MSCTRCLGGLGKVDQNLRTLKDRLPTVGIAALLDPLALSQFDCSPQGIGELKLPICNVHQRHIIVRLRSEREEKVDVTVRPEILAENRAEDLQTRDAV